VEAGLGARWNQGSSSSHWVNGGWRGENARRDDASNWGAMVSRPDCPIIVREFRGRFRRARAFGLLLVVVSVVAYLCWAPLSAMASLEINSNAMGHLSDEVFGQLVWMQILFLTLLSPMEAAPLIARERETGVGDDLLLSPLSPRRVALEKALAGAGFVGLIWLATLPLDWVVLLLGHRGLSGVWPFGLLGVAVLAWGAMLGTAVSAHSRRASGASRSANGLVILWLGASCLCAVFAGETTFGGRFPLGPGTTFPPYVAWFGRTNPVLLALDLFGSSPPIYPSKWPLCALFLLLGIPFFWWIAALGLSKPLPDLPLLSAKPRGNGKMSGVSGALSRLEMPLVGRFSPDNPVLGREVRGKFRLRQPPLPVLITEIVLALGVCAVYLLLVRQSIVSPVDRPTIFWGVAWAGFSVAVLGAIASGASALPREREGGTWESLRLSLLSPAQIVRGKLWASLGTSLVLSLPAWPLLLLCVDWSGSWTLASASSLIAPFQLLEGVGIWLGALWLQSIAALLIGVRAPKAGAATGLATLLSLGWMFGSLFLLTWDSRALEDFLGAINPFMALAEVMTPPRQGGDGGSFVPFALIVGALLLWLVEREVGAALRTERETPAS